MRLIDADVMHREIDKYDPEGRMSLKNIKRYIDAQPTAYDTDKVTEQFKECSFRDPYGYGDDLIDIGYAIEIVKDGCEPRKNLQELKLIGRQSEWIPVSERFPKNISTVIVQVKEIEKPTFGWYGSINGWRLSDKDYKGLTRFSVIAWMPLPEPYKEQNDDI